MVIQRPVSVDADAEHVSIPDLKMASAYYACVFDAETVVEKDTEARVIRIGGRLYQLDQNQGSATERHAAAVRDVDVAIARVATKGGRILSAAETVDGRRAGRVVDPFGHEWLVTDG